MNESLGVAIMMFVLRQRRGLHQLSGANSSGFHICNLLVLRLLDVTNSFQRLHRSRILHHDHEFFFVTMDSSKWRYELMVHHAASFRKKRWRCGSLRHQSRDTNYGVRALQNFELQRAPVLTRFLLL